MQNIELFGHIEREGVAIALHVLRGRSGVALIGDIVGDVHARVGETEEGAQVAPRARAIAAQIARLAVLVAAVDGDHVDAVVAVLVVAKDRAGGDAAVAAVIEQLGAGLQGVEVIDVAVNCEQNSLLYRVRKGGSGVCHTKDDSGTARQTCYYRTVTDPETLRFG